MIPNFQNLKSREIWWHCAVCTVQKLGKCLSLFCVVHLIRASFGFCCSLFLHKAQTHNPWGWDRCQAAPPCANPNTLILLPWISFPHEDQNLVKKDFNCSPITTDNLLVIPIKSKNYQMSLNMRQNIRGHTGLSYMPKTDFMINTCMLYLLTYQSIYSNEQRRKILDLEK